MAKQKMVSPEDKSLQMIPADDREELRKEGEALSDTRTEEEKEEGLNPEIGQYDRSHKQPFQKDRDDVKKALHHREKLTAQERKTAVMPKVNMTLNSGTELKAGQEAHLTDAEIDHLEHHFSGNGHHILDLDHKKA